MYLLDGAICRLIKTGEHNIFACLTFPYFRMFPKEYEINGIKLALSDDVFKFLQENLLRFSDTLSFSSWEKEVEDLVLECYDLYGEEGIDRPLLLLLSRQLVRESSWCKSQIKVEKVLEYANFSEIDPEDLSFFMGDTSVVTVYSWKKVLFASGMAVLSRLIYTKTLKMLREDIKNG